MSKPMKEMMVREYRSRFEGLSQALLLDIRRAIRDDDWSSLAEAWPVLQDPGPTGEGSPGQ